VSERIADRAEVFQGEDEKFYVRTVSTNGEGIMTSEGYNTKSYAEQVAKDTGLPVVIITKKENDNG